MFEAVSCLESGVNTKSDNVCIYNTNILKSYFQNKLIARIYY